MTNSAEISPKPLTQTLSEGHNVFLEEILKFIKKFTIFSLVLLV